MPARNVYTPSDSDPKCPETLVNKQKTARLALRDQEAAGSNPVTPMRKTAKSLRFGGLLIFAFSGLTTGSTINRQDFGIRFFRFVLFRNSVGRADGGDGAFLSVGKQVPAALPASIMTEDSKTEKHTAGAPAVHT